MQRTGLQTFGELMTWQRDSWRGILPPPGPTLLADPMLQDLTRSCIEGPYDCVLGDPWLSIKRLWPGG